MNSIQSRKPDFNKMFSNKAAFDRAVKGEHAKQVAEAVEAHARRIGRRNIEDRLENYDLRSLGSRESRNLESFNLRRFSDYLLRSVNPRIVPVSHGRIENLLMTVPTQFSQLGEVTVSSLHSRHYRRFIENFSGGRIFTILCHPDSVTEIQSWFADAGANDELRFVLSPRFDYSIWAQDAYVSISDESGREILVEGVSFPRYEDMTIADDVSEQTSVGVLQSILYFQGGNVLGGPENTLIGRDYIWRNQTRVNLETEEQVIQGFRESFGTNVIPLGGSGSAAYAWRKAGVLSGYGFQPIFHLDMYVTPTGVIGASGKEIVLLGRPGKAFEITGRWVEASAPQDEFDFSRYDDFFDETEDQLTPHYEVVHLPLMLTWGNLNFSPQELKPDYYVLSFNNVVIETFQKGGEMTGHVIMPTYSEDAAAYGMDPFLRRDLEEAAESIWNSAGFRVHKMDGMEDLAYGLGSIHCITKALSRGPWTGI